MRVRNLVTGEQLPDEIPDTFAGATFSPDGALHRLHDRRRRLAARHASGCTSSAPPSADDAKLFHEPDERYWVGAGFTRSDRYLVIGIGSSITCEEWLVDAADLRAEPRVVWPRTRRRRVRLRRTP